jgi:hypothetical protein
VTAEVKADKATIERMYYAGYSPEKAIEIIKELKNER